MTDVPAATPVTKPVEASIVATPVEPLDQVPPAVASANCVVDPTHNVAVTVIADTAGKVFTVLVIPELVATQPDALVTITSTTWPFVKADVA